MMPLLDGWCVVIAVPNSRNTPQRVLAAAMTGRLPCADWYRCKPPVNPGEARKCGVYPVREALSHARLVLLHCSATLLLTQFGDAGETGCTGNNVCSTSISLARRNGFASSATHAGLSKRPASLGYPVIIRTFSVGCRSSAHLARSTPFNPGIA